MDKKSLHIRADGNSEIGLGHIIRCIALAHMLKEDFNVVFICRYLPKELEKELELYNFSLIRIADEIEFFKVIEPKAIVVLDGYHFSADYQQQIKSKDIALACIDDLHDVRFAADLIINHTPGIKANHYKAPAHALFALGPDYTLLRPRFLQEARKNKNHETKETILICFGGSDSLNLTERALRITLKFAAFKRVIVITGASSRPPESLIRLVSHHNKVEHFHALDETGMITQLIRCDIAIVPSSGILNEAMSVGAIPISGISAENQRFVYESQKASSAIIDAGHFSEAELELAIRQSIDEGVAVKKPLDGNSGIRIRSIFNQMVKSTDVRFRKVNEGDMDVTFKWATNKTIRAHAFSRAEITWDNHSSWFRKKLQSSDCVYLLALYGEREVGSVRFDLENSTATISYLLDPEYHGQGLGVAVLASAIRDVAATSAIRAGTLLLGYVAKENIQSVKVFERLGFSQFNLDDRFRFEKKVEQ